MKNPPLETPKSMREVRRDAFEWYDHRQRVSALNVRLRNYGRRFAANTRQSEVLNAAVSSL